MPEPILPPARHEHTDATSRAALIAFPTILAGLLLSVLAVWWIYPGTTVDRRLPSPIPHYPSPRLQSDPAADMRKFRDDGTGPVEQFRLGRSRQGNRPYPDRRRDAPHRCLRHPGLAEMILFALLLMMLYGQRAQAATDLSNFAYDQHPGAQLPLTVPLKDAFGHGITLGQVLAHRPAILALGYFHCPNLCGLVRDDLMNALGRLNAPRTYSLVVLSIDPAETPADALSAQRADSARFEPAADWDYLTGSEQAVRSITDAVGFRSRFDPASKQFLHPAGLVFLTRTGTVSSYLLGLGYQPSDVGLGIAQGGQRRHRPRVADPAAVLSLRPHDRPLHPGDRSHPPARCRDHRSARRRNRHPGPAP